MVPHLPRHRQAPPAPWLRHHQRRQARQGVPRQYARLADTMPEARRRTRRTWTTSWAPADSSQNAPVAAPSGTPAERIEYSHFITEYHDHCHQGYGAAPPTANGTRRRSRPRRSSQATSGAPARPGAQRQRHADELRRGHVELGSHRRNPVKKKISISGRFNCHLTIPLETSGLTV